MSKIENTKKRYPKIWPGKQEKAKPATAGFSAGRRRPQQWVGPDGHSRMETRRGGADIGRWRPADAGRLAPAEVGRLAPADAGRLPPEEVGR